MKKRTIITSVLVIVLCLGLISGSTFALFTSESKVNIAVTSGKVKITATVSDPTLYSATADTSILGDSEVDVGNVAGVLEGTFAGTYYYHDRTEEQEFLNGGTATIEDGVLTISKITPGDKVVTTVEVANESNVAIQYRVKVNVLSGLKLYEGLVVKVDGLSLSGLSKTGNWTYKAAPTTTSTTPGALATIPVEVYLPLEAGNEYQDLSTSMQITVEAVQGNANVTNEVLAQVVEATQDVAAGDSATVISDNNGLVEVTVPKAAINDSLLTTLALKVTPQDTVSTINITSLQDTLSYDVKILETTTTSTTSAIKENNEAAITVRMFIGTGLKGVELYHKTTSIPFTYDETTGYIEFTTTSFSEYTVVFNKEIAVEKGGTITVYTPTEDAGVYETIEGTQVVYDENTEEFSDFGDSVARIGTTGYPTLQGAIDAAQTGEVVVLLKNVTGDRITITKSITLDGNDHKLTDETSGGRAIWIYDTNVIFTIKNITIDGANKCERGLQVNKLDNVWNNATIIMDNCVIKNMTTYAINFNTNTTVNMTIKNSSISGWAALNAYGTGNVITAINSEFIGINNQGYNSDGWNNFATICLEGDTTGQTDLHSSDYTITFTNCSLEATQTTGNKQAILGFNNHSQNSSVTFTDCTFDIGEGCYFGYDKGNTEYPNSLIIDNKTITMPRKFFNILSYNNTILPVVVGTESIVDQLTELGYTVVSTGIETAANNYGFNKNGYSYVKYMIGDLVYRYYEGGKVYLDSASNYTGNSLVVDNVDGIRWNAFSNNETIKTLTINCDLEFAGKVLENNVTVESVVLAEGVTKFNNRLLYKSKVTSISLPNTLTTIDEGAASQAYSLASITVPSSVQTIGKEAFAYCSDLETIIFEGSPTIDMYYIGRACAKLTDVWFHGNGTEFTNTSKVINFSHTEGGVASGITVHFVSQDLKNSYEAINYSNDITCVLIPQA